jgi:hypothetical protein
MSESFRDEVKKFGGIRPAARELGIPESSLRYKLDKEAKEERRASLRATSLPAAVRFPVPEEGVSYFILTSAQDCTKIHEDFFANLLAYRAWLQTEYDAPCNLMVGGFTYNKKLFEEHDPSIRSDKVWFDERLDPYIIHERVDIGDKLSFCGEMNTLPTAVQPLSGFETYTRDKWGIFPHAKVQLRSIPTQKNALTKVIMTTGAVTMPNYIRKKAGIKATFHHVVGAVIVAVASSGAFWCRHIQANSLKDGSFYDLDRHISKGEITKGHRAEALTYGDIHHEKLDPLVARQTWGYDVEEQRVIHNECLDGWLRPKHRFLHDLSDFAPRNHHNIKDHHFRFLTHQTETDNVEEALVGCAAFLQEVSKARFDGDDCQTIVVQSNHDNALLKWLKTADYKVDPENAVFFLECELEMHRWLRTGNDCPIFELVLKKAGIPDNVQFVGEDDSFITCGDIENAMHGHLGANGAKASPAAFTRMGSKSITGHTHSPGITDGNMTVGVSGGLDMGYNKGLSSWLHAHGLTQPNGKRQLLVMMNGQFTEIGI